MGRRHDEKVPPGWKVVYTPYITDRRTGRRIYPRNAKVFRFLVRAS